MPEALATDLGFRAKLGLAEEGTSYPQGFDNLRAAVNSDEAVSQTIEKYMAKLTSASAHVGKPGGMNNAQWSALYDSATTSISQLEHIHEVLKTGDLTTEQAQALGNLALAIGNGEVRNNPSEVSTYIADMGFRAKFHISGLPGTPYPADKGNLVASLNLIGTLETGVENLRGVLAGEGGGGPQPASANSISQRIATLKQLQALLQTGNLSTEQVNVLTQAVAGAQNLGSDANPQTYFNGYLSALGLPQLTA